MPKKQNRPGVEARVSGQYELMGARGAGTGTEVTVVRGEPFPPTPGKRMSYHLRDRTKHR